MTEETKRLSEQGDSAPLDRTSCSLSSLTDSLETDDQSVEQDELSRSQRSKLPIKIKRVEKTQPEKNCLRLIENDSVLDENGVGVKGKYRWECSAKNTCTSLGCDDHSARETITSRMRVERSHIKHGSFDEPDDYMTPTQRKGQTIRELRRQVRELQREVESGKQELSRLREGLDRELRTVLEHKDEDIRELRTCLDSTDSKYQELTLSYQQSINSVNQLETQLGDLTVKYAERERHHTAMYLEMYEKGKQSAVFERQDELEMLVKNGKGHVSVKELMRKLSESQAELAKWQSLRRQEMYVVNEGPDTEAETTLKFLKDSFFHFLVSDRDADDHLRAMIEIFSFSDVQKKKMMKALKDRRKSSGKT